MFIWDTKKKKPNLKKKIKIVFGFSDVLRYFSLPSYIQQIGKNRLKIETIYK